MKSRSPIVIAFGVGAVALLSLFAALDYYRVTIQTNEQRPDPYRIGYQEPRFREVIEMLPVDAVIGYLSDVEFETLQGAAAFFGAQYALAPRILVPHTSPHAKDLVLGNFSTDVEISAIAKEHRVHVVRSFEAGVVLFRKGERK
jgi:hypothetical protein